MKTIGNSLNSLSWGLILKDVGMTVLNTKRSSEPQYLIIINRIRSREFLFSS